MTVPLLSSTSTSRSMALSSLFSAGSLLPLTRLTVQKKRSERRCCTGQNCNAVWRPYHHLPALRDGPACCCTGIRMREPCCRNPDSSFTCGGRICRSHHLKIVVLALFLAHVQGRGC